MHEKLKRMLESYFVAYGLEGQTDVRYMAWCMVRLKDGQQLAYVWHFKEYYQREKACIEAWKVFKDPEIGLLHASLIFAIFEVAFDKDFGKVDKEQVQ